MTRKTAMSRFPILTSLLHRFETSTLTVLAVIAGAFWAFVGIAEEMVEGDLHAFDEAVMLALRVPGQPDNPIGGPEIEIAMRDLTALGGVTVLTLMTVSVLVYLLLVRQRGSAALLAVSIAGGQALSHLAKLGFGRPRPDLVSHAVEVSTSSFPSGHSMMSAVTYLTLAVMLARADGRHKIRVFYIVVAAVLAMLVGISRVYLGVHWPSDVLAGWSLGAAWALGVAMVARWLARRGKIES